MFYSQMLLSKKGPLGTVWIAAHCYRKLKKDQVQQTNISSSVDKILEDEVSAHRILAYLLLGVVRIYSKKVEYLYHDCNDVLDKLCGFKIGKSTHVNVRFGGGLARTRHAVKRPKRFELDAFDFQKIDDRNLEGRNVRPPETLMRKEDGLGEEGNMSHLLCKEKMPYRENSTTSHTPPRDVLSPHSMEREMYVGPSHNMHESASNSDIFCETDFSLEDRLEPMVLDEAEEELMHQKSPTDGLNNHDNDDYGSDAENRTDSVPVLEKGQGIEISLADHVNTMVLDETEKEQMDDKLKRHSLTEEEPHKSIKSVNETPVSKKRHWKDERTVSITVDVTPDSKIAEHGVGAQNFTAVPTPAPRESRKILKKRKFLFDSTLVVSNKIYKDWMKKPRDLMRKNPTGPLTRLQVWRAHKFCRIPESFLEPLIPCISMDVCSIECKKKTTGSKTLENKDDVSSPVVHEDREKNSEVRDTETRKFPEDAPIAPGTPVTQVHLNSSRLHDETEVVAANSHHDGTTSLPSNEEIQLDAIFYTEEENSSDGDSRQSDAYSARTRMAERYLRKNFISKKWRKEDEVLNLSQLLSKQRKKESARLFYEILVLKTLDRIDVQQECAYGDICLLKTSKFQA